MNNTRRASTALLLALSLWTCIASPSTGCDGSEDRRRDCAGLDRRDPALVAGKSTTESSRAGSSGGGIFPTRVLPRAAQLPHELDESRIIANGIE